LADEDRIYSTAPTGRRAAGRRRAAAPEEPLATERHSTERRPAEAPATEPPADTSALSIRPPAEDVSRRAAEREEAANAKPALARVLQALVAAVFPVILLAGAVRAVTSSVFLWVEYHRPGFPADSYGFSTEDRMTYASYTVDYILNWAPPRYLAAVTGADGEQLFLDSEVGHMADVKTVLVMGFAAASLLLLFSIIACLYLCRRYKGGVRRALFAGAAVTIGLMAALAAAAVLAWEQFFTQVHALFFTDGTWTFRMSDTLIRLFPQQFWLDAALTVGVLVLAAAVLTLVPTWPTRARREESRAAQEALQARYRHGPGTAAAPGQSGPGTAAAPGPRSSSASTSATASGHTE
jgi:integral membrane protein (TIGR01906 family)